MGEHPYGWLSVLPPVIAIVLAIVTRRIVFSLIAGVFAGALMMARGDLVTAVYQTWEIHLWQTLIDPGKLRVFSFTLLMGAMIGVISASGGMHGLINLVTPWASTRRRGQLTTWFLGLLIFFDDYANTILLGNTLRPITDRLRISREKLAYLVDSTAAPVAGLAFVSTWIAVELEYIATGLEASGVEGRNAFSVFVATIPYRFYVWGALILVPLTALLGRDFPPMWKAEMRQLTNEEDDAATETTEVATPPSANWLHAVIPIGVTLALVVYFIYQTGSVAVSDRVAGEAIEAIKTDAAAVADGEVSEARQMLEAARESGRLPETLAAIEMLHDRVESLSPRLADSEALQPNIELWDIAGGADSTIALQYGALVGIALAILMPWVARTVPLDDLFVAAGNGARVVLPAIAILWTAGTLSRMTTDRPVEGDVADTPYAFQEYRLYTASFLTDLLGGGADASPANEPGSAAYSAAFLPTIIFVLAAIVAFCTGTSWGTMGILVPMVIPLSYALLARDGGVIGVDHPILLCSIAGVLAGAVLGDHCSPISDTTVLSSQSAGCDHLAHVWTQMPYALSVGLVSVLLGTLPLGFGVSVWLLLPLQFAAIFGMLYCFGRRVAA